jgi:hypothetical protein
LKRKDIEEEQAENSFGKDDKGSEEEPVVNLSDKDEQGAWYHQETIRITWYH